MAAHSDVSLLHVAGRGHCFSTGAVLETASERDREDSFVGQGQDAGAAGAASVEAAVGVTFADFIGYAATRCASLGRKRTGGLDITHRIAMNHWKVPLEVCESIEEIGRHGNRKSWPMSQVSSEFVSCQFLNSRA